jgi:hypothetical protein
MTRAYTLFIACKMASAAAARTYGGSLRKIALYMVQQWRCESPRLSTISRRELLKTVADIVNAITIEPICAMSRKHIAAGISCRASFATNGGVRQLLGNASTPCP